MVFHLTNYVLLQLKLINEENRLFRNYYTPDVCGAHNFGLNLIY